MSQLVYECSIYVHTSYNYFYYLTNNVLSYITVQRVSQQAASLLHDCKRSLKLLVAVCTGLHFNLSATDH